MADHVLLLGAGGLVGTSLAPALAEAGYRVTAVSSREVDLRDTRAAAALIESTTPDLVVHAAGRVGGIGANIARGFQLGSDNALLAVSVLGAALEAGVERLVYLGCACSYPNDRQGAMTPKDLFDGPIEPTSRAYALAKSLGIEMTLQARHAGRAWVAVVPSNLFGPGDDFDADRAHVVPAMIRRLHEAARSRDESVVFRGSGRSVRQFLYAGDLASALLTVCREIDRVEEVVNVGGDSIAPVSEVASTVAGIVGYAGVLQWDPEANDGTAVKILDDAPIRAAGWSPCVSLTDGLERTYRWVLAAASDGSLRGWVPTA